MGGGGGGGGAQQPQQTQGNMQQPPILVQPTAPRVPEIDARLRKFYQAAVNAAGKERPGLRCDGLAAAYLTLEPSDEREATNTQQGRIVEAKTCIPLLTASNERVEPLATAYKRFA